MLNMRKVKAGSKANQHSAAEKFRPMVASVKALTSGTLTCSFPTDSAIVAGQTIYMEFYYKFNNGETAIDPAKTVLNRNVGNVSPRLISHAAFTDIDNNPGHIFKYVMLVKDTASLGADAIELTFQTQAIGATVPVTCNCKYYVLPDNCLEDETITVSFDKGVILDETAPSTVSVDLNELNSIGHITGTIRYTMPASATATDKQHQNIQVVLQPTSMSRSVCEQVFYFSSDTNQPNKNYPDKLYNYVEKAPGTYVGGYILNLTMDASGTFAETKFRLYPCGKDAGYLIFTIGASTFSFATYETQGLFIEGVKPEFQGYSLYFDNTSGSHLADDLSWAYMHFKTVEEAPSNFVGDILIVFHQAIYIDQMGTRMPTELKCIGIYDVPLSVNPNIRTFGFETKELMVREDYPGTTISNDAKNYLYYVVAEKGGNVGCSEKKILIVEEIQEYTPAETGSFLAPVFIDIDGNEVTNGEVINGRRIGHGLPNEKMYYRIPVENNLLAGDKIDSFLTLNYYNHGKQSPSMSKYFLTDYEVTAQDVAKKYIEREIAYSDLCYCDSDPYGIVSSRFEVWYTVKGNVSGNSSLLNLPIDTVM